MCVEFVYGCGDVGVVFDGVNELVVCGVEIDMFVSGIIVCESVDSVVDGVIVCGVDEFFDGFMGVVFIGEWVVVQDLMFIDGCDGVYIYCVDGSVVCDNCMEDGCYGVYQMYIFEVFVVDNVVCGDCIGVVFMMWFVGNFVVGNDVCEFDFGFMFVGSDIYVVDNVFVGNDYGMDVSGDWQVYVGNVVVGNGVGVCGSLMFLMNVVV